MQIMIRFDQVKTMLCDSHTHLDLFPREALGPMLERARAAGVGIIITVGTTLESSALAVGLAHTDDILCAGVGIHPMDMTTPFTDSDYAALRELAMTGPRVVAISETGLDFLDRAPDRSWQDHAFREQIRLARELAKPVIFHARAAYEVILEVLRAEKASEVGAIWHYFQGDERKAREAIDMGFLVSLAKPLLRLPSLQEAVRHIPLESMVLETDCYPEPRAKPARQTEPAHVRMVAEKIAELKGVTFDEVAETTTANLKRVLGLTSR